MAILKPLPWLAPPAPVIALKTTKQLLQSEPERGPGACPLFLNLPLSQNSFARARTRVERCVTCRASGGGLTHPRSSGKCGQAVA